MMKPVNSRNFLNLPCRLDRSSFGRIFVDPEVNSIFVVIGQVIRKNRLQMILIQNDHMIQAFTFYAPYYPFNIAVLPG